MLWSLFYAVLASALVTQVAVFSTTIYAFTEVEGDPHSPHLHGFWSVQLGNVFHYVREAHNPETVDRYARDIEEDRCDRTIFRVGLLGPTIGTVGLCLILGLSCRCARPATLEAAASTATAASAWSGIGW